MIRILIVIVFQYFELIRYVIDKYRKNLSEGKLVLDERNTVLFRFGRGKIANVRSSYAYGR